MVVADGDRFDHGYDHDHVNGAIGGTSPLSFMPYRTLILSDIWILPQLRPYTRKFHLGNDWGIGRV